MAWQGLAGMVRFGMVRQGGARSGEAWYGVNSYDLKIKKSEKPSLEDGFSLFFIFIEVPHAVSLNL